ncbi:IclR family transcriptional regulator [Micromonospora inositola]|uniref:Transcriptional regulator, IclR family n=1 Tax=Micromonospora inositola TaxID=47865 RepID=A0A1C5K6G8_9ACTN|nr:IclR family transcriptional regulator [Micromonospora inositola]SCG78036.1 transcriptional regulator, IclR family [Micromonospora inositola]
MPDQADRMAPAPYGTRVDDRAEPLGSVEKALIVLDAFRTGYPVIGLSEIARRTGLAKTTALRLLTSLEESGYLKRVGTQYRLDWRVLELGRGAMHCEPGGLRDIALPYLSELHVESGSTVNLAVLDGPDVLYLIRIHRGGSMKLPGGIGARVPATCTALGKAILAFRPAETVQTVVANGMSALTKHSLTTPGLLAAQLARVREEGLAFEREESAVGVVCIAAPILHRGTAVAAISVSGRAERPAARSLDGLIRKAAASTASDYAVALGRYRRA